MYLDETGVDVVGVIFRGGEGELYSAVVDWKERKICSCSSSAPLFEKHFFNPSLFVVGINANVINVEVKTQSLFE